MNDTLKKVLNIVLKIIIFVASTTCVILGQQHTGLGGLLVMILGLGGLLFLLWLYNKKYK